MFDKSPQYHVRILRFWAERNPDSQQKSTTWRFSLENPETGKRRSATDLDSLLNILQTDILHSSVAEDISQEQEGDSS